MPYLNTTLTSCRNTVPDFQAVTGAWSTSGTWSDASGDSINPSGNNIYANRNIALSGEFEIRWKFNPGGTSAAGMDFGIGPSSAFPDYRFPSSGISNDYIGFFDRPVNGSIYCYQYGAQSDPPVIDYNTGFRTTDFLYLTRDASNNIRLENSSRSVLHTFGVTVSTTVMLMAAVSTDSNNCAISDIAYREVYTG